MILLKKLRIEKGLSQVDLANVSGAEKTSISNIENAHYRTVTPNMQKLADYFELKDPLLLTKKVPEDILTTKGCLNQRCLLNSQCFCQSDQVIRGASCDNQNAVSNPTKRVIIDTLSRLYADI